MNYYTVMTTAGRESKSISVTIPAPYVTVLSPMLQLYQMTEGLSISGGRCGGECDRKTRKGGAAKPHRPLKARSMSMLFGDFKFDYCIKTDRTTVLVICTVILVH